MKGVYLKANNIKGEGEKVWRPEFRFVFKRTFSMETEKEEKGVR